jgi:flagellin-like hook-associated protein FlgL
MSGIVLSAAVRQNLLSLQDTANLLSQTQTALATGNKVNSALDNPIEFFTSQALNNRASDISNLLDSIGNGVQVLQAANTGITSLSSLVDSAKSIANQVLQQPSGYTSKASVTFTGTASSPTGTISASDLNEGLNAGAVFTFKTATGTAAITLGSTPSPFSGGAATVKSLTDFNQALSDAGVNLTATLNSDGTLTFTSTNDAAGQTITTGGTAPTASDAVDVSVTGGNLGTATTATADPVSQSSRASLVAQFNQVIQQIDATAQDSSFNGINLLNGDTLKLVFDETGKSSLTIQGVTFNSSGLGLSALTSGTDFTDNFTTNQVLTALNTASTTLRSQAAAFGTNLSVVQIRQDFNKNIINVLQTGSANLTLADANEEAANSQALSTRQSIAVSALALANQSQVSVLQLLR